MFKFWRGKKEKTTEEHEGPIQKRNIRSVAASFASNCEAIARLPDQGDGPLRNMAECFAIQIKLLAETYKDHAEENESLMQINQIYNSIGRIERKFQHDIKEQVIDPLKGWLSIDYVRMNGEIQKLNALKMAVKKAEEFAKKSKDPKDQTAVEECRKAYEGQMNVVKMELLKLSDIKLKHSLIFEKFLDLQKDYHTDLHAMMVVNNASKWATTISTGFGAQ